MPVSSLLLFLIKQNFSGESLWRKFWKQRLQGSLSNPNFYMVWIKGIWTNMECLKEQILPFIHALCHCLPPCSSCICMTGVSNGTLATVIHKTGGQEHEAWPALASGHAAVPKWKCASSFLRRDPGDMQRPWGPHRPKMIHPCWTFGLSSPQLGGRWEAF